MSKWKKDKRSIVSIQNDTQKKKIIKVDMYDHEVVFSVSTLSQ